MKLLSNAHTHTIWCDGNNTPEEMIQAAIARGFVSLGFSIHGWTPYEPCGVSLEREANCRRDLRILREKYRGQIEIIIGAERDALYDRDFSDYEYLIDSTHVLMKNGEYLGVDWGDDIVNDNVRRHFGGDYYAYCKYYYEFVSQVCERSDALFIGHIDLVTKFNEDNRYFDEIDPRYLKPAFEAVESAVRRGKPLEINTGAIPRGYRSRPYPSVPILKHIRSLGGEIMINSDAHSAEAIDACFDDALLLAQECGFDHILRLRESGLEEVGIL